MLLRMPEIWWIEVGFFAAQELLNVAVLKLELAEACAC